MEYIKGNVENKEKGECVFCELPKIDDDKEALILYRGKYSYIVLNKYPYNTAHLMVVPYRHVPNVTDLTEEELSEMSRLVRASVKAIKEEYRPHAFNIGANIGECAGAGVAGHFHIHVLPRWCGDTNYTLILARTKVLPETLERTWERLKPVIERVCREEC
jgi:ATP adenylyltransferase